VTGALRLIRPGGLSGDTAQTSGMRRAAAISGAQVGAAGLWMGRTVMVPGGVSGDHHHGASETGIYVVAGTPAFAFRDPGSGQVVRLQASPGDFVWVPPHVPHRRRTRRRTPRRCWSSPARPRRRSWSTCPACDARPRRYGRAAISSLTGLRRPA
jgi:uncharacterized RmlC-like cupin family protein